MLDWDNHPNNTWRWRRAVFWNDGRPFIIDSRNGRAFDIDPNFPKADLRLWAAENDCRCVGFERGSRPARRSQTTRESSWAVV